MKHRLKIAAYCFVLLGVLTGACRGGRTHDAAAGKTEQFRYAANLQLVHEKDYTVATLRNPWDTLSTLHTYVLVEKDKPLPPDLPKGTVVRTPLTRAAVYSSVHCGLLQQLGRLSAVAGVCDLSYIRLAAIHDAVKAGRTTDLGSSLAPDVERLIDLAPDAILLSPFENSGYGRVEQIGIPIVECADYMETSPLGQAEWMRFYGCLFGCEKTADSLFAVVESRYLTLKERAASLPSHPSVISELKSSGTWYVPGGRSTTAIYYRDAGAHYLWKDDAHSGSIPLSAEAVMDKGAEADYWLIKYNQPHDKTLGELKADYAPYARFRAFKEHRVYGCNTNEVVFYEETCFRPDLFLEELIKIFHPQLLESDTLRYFKPLAE